MEFEISLSDVRLYGYHGVTEEENYTGNTFRLSLSIFIPVTDDMKKDELEYTISYADLFSIVMHEWHLPRKLLEKVALNIVNVIKEKYPQITRGQIRIEKERPPIRGMVGNAAVTLFF